MLYSRFLEELKDSQKREENYITTGKLEDFSTYKFSVGKIRGLQDAIDICQNVLKRSELDE